MDGWIKCDEQKPPEGTYVFGAVYGWDVIIPEEGETIQDAVIRNMMEHKSVKICQWLGEDEGWWDNYGMMVVQPLYWMPINRPLPPILTKEEIFSK